MGWNLNELCGFEVLELLLHASNPSHNFKGMMESIHRVLTSLVLDKSEFFLYKNSASY